MESGIASVIPRSSSSEQPRKQIDWGGDNNLFAGWKGFFACGNDPTVTVPGLAEVRSTWNGTDRKSGDPPSVASSRRSGQAVPANLSPFVPNREAILRRAAAPGRPVRESRRRLSVSADSRAGGWAFDARPSERLPVSESAGPRTLPARHDEHAAVVGTCAAPLALGRRPVELTFDTGSQPWDGDLGAFLRDRLTAGTDGTPRVRVRRLGAPSFTPVRLPAGSLAGDSRRTARRAEPPSWSPKRRRHRHGIDRARTGVPWFSRTSSCATKRPRGWNI